WCSLPIQKSRLNHEGNEVSRGPTFAIFFVLLRVLRGDIFSNCTATCKVVHRTDTVDLLRYSESTGVHQMSPSSVDGVTPSLQWFELYQHAVVEIDDGKLQQKIGEA